VKNPFASNDILSPYSENSGADEPLNRVAHDFVKVTHRQWSSPLAIQAPEQSAALDTVHSPSAVRDRFLDALDADDLVLVKRVALDLVRSRNPLPGMTCEKLGLPPGSTYGAAARHVLAIP
jgi:hypothetical protein